MKLLEKKKKPAFRAAAASIKEKAKLFVDDRNNANNILSVIAAAHEATGGSPHDAGVQQACISAILKMATHSISQGWVEIDSIAQECMNGDISEAKFSSWMKGRIDDSMGVLLTLAEEGLEIGIQEAALVAYMKILVADGIRPAKIVARRSGKHAICEKMFNRLIKVLLSNTKDMTPVLSRFQEYAEKLDVTHCVLLYLNNELKKPVVSSEIYWTNFFAFLEMVKVDSSEEEDELSFLIPVSHSFDDSDTKRIVTFPEDRKLFTSVWTTFLQSSLPPNIFKKALVILADSVIPFLTSPLALTDFLIKAYDMGGVVSILALNGIFILIHRYNLEYPNFYKKLYSLLKDANIFGAKYRARFFFLVDLFLTSTHIPAYLVCAFMKRLGRLALVAPPTGIIIILNLLRNLLIKHPNAQILLHCPNEASCLDDDPYDENEVDPALCRAMESSLWEVASLSNHYYPLVAKLASSLTSQPITGLEKELGEFLEQTEDDLFLKETKTKFRHVAANHLAPTGLFIDGDSTNEWLTDTCMV